MRTKERWIHFNYYIAFVCTSIVYLVYIVFTKEDCICEKQKQKKKILFVVTW